MSTATKFTAGPWFSFDVGIFAEIDGAKRIIATCFGRVGEKTYLDSPANARLIAAAPELLEALGEAMPWINTSDDLGKQVWQRCHAALAKAEGRQ